MNNFSALFIFGLLSLRVAAAERDQAKHSEDAADTAAKYREAIQSEITSRADHDWAGEYYYGDGLGVNVRLLLAPDSGYLFEWRGCMGLYDRNYGPITATGGTIRLSFTFENTRKGFQGIAEEFIPVHWGERTYLIATGEVVAFCNSINAGRESREDMHGRFLLRRGDAEKPVTGFPDVPSEYIPYLLEQPVEAVVTSVDAGWTKEGTCGSCLYTPVHVNAGADNGLRPGMELNVISPPSRQHDSIILTTNIGPDFAEGIMTRAGDGDPEPEPGWKLSTRLGWK